VAPRQEHPTLAESSRQCVSGTRRPGRNFAATRKYRNTQATPHDAFVVDDVLPPWRPRWVMIQGRALAVPAREGVREAMIRLAPEKVTSWDLDEQPS
jgi:pyridoxamine 5'-phosphate oxidase family protein